MGVIMGWLREILRYKHKVPTRCNRQHQDENPEGVPPDPQRLDNILKLFKTTFTFTTRRPVFDKVPYDIWYLILTDHLDPASASSFALTCRTAHGIYGKQCFAKLRMPKNFYFRLKCLELMDQSMPAHFLCPYYAVFHQRKSEKNKWERRYCTGTDQYKKKAEYDPSGRKYEPFEKMGPRFDWTRQQCLSDACVFAVFGNYSLTREE